MIWNFEISLVLIFLFSNDQGNHNNIIYKDNRGWETSNQKYPEQQKRMTEDASKKKSAMYIIVLAALYQI